MESGQSQFATLKLRSLALVPSSGALPRPPNSTPGSSTARLFPPRHGALVRDLRPFRSIAIIAIKFGLYCKPVYICTVVKADCAAALGLKKN